MEKFIKEHKKISFFIISAAVFYFLIAAPLEKLNSSIKIWKIKRKDLKGLFILKKL